MKPSFSRAAPPLPDPTPQGSTVSTGNNTTKPAAHWEDLATHPGHVLAESGLAHGILARYPPELNRPPGASNLRNKDRQLGPLREDHHVLDRIVWSHYQTLVLPKMPLLRLPLYPLSVALTSPGSAPL